MGYSLVIGEAFTEPYDEEDPSLGDRVWAEEVRHDDAPAFGEPTDYTNTRWPSYSAWHNFVAAAKLEHVLLEHNEYGVPTGHMKGGHPGAMFITEDVKREVDKACQRLKMQSKTGGESILWHYNRAQWLKYWVDWSLKNCEHPVLANS